MYTLRGAMTLKDGCIEQSNLRAPKRIANSFAAEDGLMV